MTISDAVDFVYNNRYRGNRRTFDGWNRSQIAVAIKEAIDCNGFAFATDRGRIAGLVIAKPNESTQTLHISHVLGKTGALKALIKSYKQMYSGYRITALRDNKPVVYSTERFVRLAERL